MPTTTTPIPETAAKLRWILPGTDRAATEALAAALHVPSWLAAILLHRGLANPADAHAFLHPHFDTLHDPALLHGMAAAVDRILHAVAAREPILIYGDYDVDGTLATVLLKTAIDRLTLKAPQQPLDSLVRYHIPHRIREGYGVQPAVLATAAAEGVRLVISVDTGIRAFAAAAEAKALGLDLIVTDHHLPDGLGLPDALAVINPNQAGCPYPFKDLCGAAVAFKLASALLLAASARGLPSLQPIDEPAVRTRLLPSLLKLVAIATVADAVPLHGENRVIVALGLQSLQQVHQPGLRALLHYAEVLTGSEPPTATAIAFRVAPRINAAGRMDIASDVVRMLLTRDPEEGRALAEKLHRLNTDRRTVEASVLEQIDAILTSLDPATLPNCLVLDGPDWHRGVVGILASRVVERTNRPALVITHEDGHAHGSGRSVAGFHLLDAITAVHLAHAATPEPLFTRFGGHAHAIGFSLPSAHVPHLRTHLTAYAASRLAPSLLEPTLTLHAELPLAAITPNILADLRRLEPFGHAAAEPAFLARAVTIASLRVLKDTHLKLTVQQASGPALPCLAWSRKHPWPQRLDDLGITTGSLVDIAFHLRENRHPDFGGPELQLLDLRLHI